MIGKELNIMSDKNCWKEPKHDYFICEKEKDENAPYQDPEKGVVEDESATYQDPEKSLVKTDKYGYVKPTKKKNRNRDLDTSKENHDNFSLEKENEESTDYQDPEKAVDELAMDGFSKDDRDINENKLNKSDENQTAHVTLDRSTESTDGKEANNGPNNPPYLDLYGPDQTIEEPRYSSLAGQKTSQNPNTEHDKTSKLRETRPLPPTPANNNNYNVHYTASHRTPNRSLGSFMKITAENENSAYQENEDLYIPTIILYGWKWIILIVLSIVSILFVVIIVLGAKLNQNSEGPVTPQNTEPSCNWSDWNTWTGCSNTDISGRQYRFRITSQSCDQNLTTESRKCSDSKYDLSLMFNAVTLNTEHAFLTKNGSMLSNYFIENHQGSYGQQLQKYPGVIADPCFSPNTKIYFEIKYNLIMLHSSIEAGEVFFEVGMLEIDDIDAHQFVGDNEKAWSFNVYYDGNSHAIHLAAQRGPVEKPLKTILPSFTSTGTEFFEGSFGILSDRERSELSLVDNGQILHKFKEFNSNSSICPVFGVYASGDSKTTMQIGLAKNYTDLFQSFWP